MTRLFNTPEEEYAYRVAKSSQSYYDDRGPQYNDALGPVWTQERATRWLDQHKKHGFSNPVDFYRSNPKYAHLVAGAEQTYNQLKHWGFVPGYGPGGKPLVEPTQYQMAQAAFDDTQSRILEMQRSMEAAQAAQAAAQQQKLLEAEQFYKLKLKEQADLLKKLEEEARAQAELAAKLREQEEIRAMEAQRGLFRDIGRQEASQGASRSGALGLSGEGTSGPIRLFNL